MRRLDTLFDEAQWLSCMKAFGLVEGGPWSVFFFPSLVEGSGLVLFHPKKGSELLVNHFWEAFLLAARRKFTSEKTQQKEFLETLNKF